MPQGARSKTRKPRKSRKFFPEIFESEFSILAVEQNRKLGNKKTRNNISEISEVSEFSICHFFIFQKTFSFQYSTVGNSVLYIYVMFCFQSLLTYFFLHQKYMFKILPCGNKIYLLWDVSIHMRTWGMLISNSVKGFEVNENFPRIPSFRFQVYGKIENSETSEMGIFLLKPHYKIKIFIF